MDVLGLIMGAGVDEVAPGIPDRAEDEDTEVKLVEDMS